MAHIQLLEMWDGLGADVSKLRPMPTVIGKAVFGADFALVDRS